MGLLFLGLGLLVLVEASGSGGFKGLITGQDIEALPWGQDIEALPWRIERSYHKCNAHGWYIFCLGISPFSVHNMRMKLCKHIVTTQRP